MFFLALLYLITERLRANTWHTPADYRSWALIGLLMLGASGAKATVLPVIIIGTGLYCVLHFLIRRAVPASAVVATCIGIVIFAATYLVVYAGSAPDTIVKPLAWLGNTPPVIFADGIHHVLLRVIALPFAYAAGLVGLMLPLSGALYLLRRHHRAEIPSFALPLCMLAGGIVITNLVHQISFSEGYFEETGYVAGAIVAAAGLRLAWLDVGRFSRRAIVVLLAAWLVLFVVVIKLVSRSITTPDATMALYAGVVVAGVIFVLGSALVVRHREASASGAIALGLIPLVAASVLTTPLYLYPTLRKAVTGLPLTAARPVVVPGLLTALQWLRDHSPIDAVFAVNNHWLDPGRTNGKYYYYSAFSERQIFIEAYDPIRYGVTPGVGSTTADAFAYRQRLNDAVFDHADTNALRIMTREYGVRFLFVDRMLGTEDAAVLQLGREVFANQDAIVLEVG